MADFDPKNERWLQRLMPLKIMEASSQYVSLLLLHSFSFFLSAVIRFLSSDFDKSTGRVQILGGDLYYSPNSSRTVQLPAPHIWGSNPFSPPHLPNGKRNLWQLETSVYEQPRWWDDNFGWLAFYNKDIINTPSVLLRCLKNSTMHLSFEEHVGYALSHRQAEEWLHLDKQLSRAYTELHAHYRNIVAFSPPNPWEFGYLRPHSKHGILSLCLQKSSQWFGLWLSLMSYVIAGLETQEVLTVKYSTLARQNWKDLLVTKCADVQIDHAWIDLLLDSSVTSFSPNIL